MGLNICRSIVESHEGRLIAENNTSFITANDTVNTFENEVFMGCTFTILLPIEAYLLTTNQNLQNS